MDEPFSALDPISREQLQDELKSLQKSIQKTIVFVTHDMDEDLKVADEIVVMKDGGIQQIASPIDLIQHPANDFVRSFIGEERVNQASNNKKEYLASSIMKPLVQNQHLTEVPKLSQDTSLQEVARVILLSQSDAVILCDQAGQPIGVIEKNHLLHELAGIPEEV